jgi:hypothetical protein
MKEILSYSEGVTLGRMRRKHARALKQRDHWKAEYDKLRDVMNDFPRIESSHKRLLSWREEVQRVRALEQRVKEQAALIELLQKGATP